MRASGEGEQAGFGRAPVRGSSCGRARPSRPEKHGGKSAHAVARAVVAQQVDVDQLGELVNRRQRRRLPMYASAACIASSTEVETFTASERRGQAGARKGA